MSTCRNCPCKITRGEFCRGCRNPGNHGRYSFNVTCVVCGDAVCLDHAEARAVAQNCCQMCLNGAGESSAEEEVFSDEDHIMEDDESTDDDSVMSRILPAWMRDARFVAVGSIYIPLYLRPDGDDPSPPSPHTSSITLTETPARLALCDTCAVCLVEFKEGERVATLSCHDSHVFHTPCIETWWQRKRACPMCKTQ